MVIQFFRIIYGLAVKLQATSLKPPRMNWLFAVVTISKIKENRFFSILADEASDYSNQAIVSGDKIFG